MIELGHGATRRAIAGVLLLESFNTTLQAYGSLNSSPWTAENFGGDMKKNRSVREYVMHAIGVSMVMAAASSWTAQTPVPLLGSLAGNTYLWWIYQRALRRAEDDCSDGWRSGAKTVRSGPVVGATAGGFSGTRPYAVDAPGSGTDGSMLQRLSIDANEY